jgi:hypothetical protein
VRMDDEPVKETIKNWNVKQLVVHRSRRHLDKQVVYEFFGAVDDWILKNKSWICVQ